MDHKIINPKSILMKTIKLSFILLISLFFASGESSAFCGFYVARADAKLFNKSSQVIIVRDGDKSVITMSNDFQGSVKDFAMVVPVPEVLKRENIRIANQTVFDKLDAYSGPRLVEYYDQNPCYDYEMLDMVAEEAFPSMAMGSSMRSESSKAKKYNVTIEATYTVGEYDIIILSAKESDGLKRWLIDNEYTIPESAEEVLEPYIKNDMKFFVVKVNLEKQKAGGFTTLRPIQIAFHSDKFMLPIRLGMANAESSQDLVVYAFTKKGRVETTNYRTVEIPSNMNIPEFVQGEFRQFYVDLFNTAFERERKNAVFLEYAWDVSFSNPVKCDPCVGPPPVYNDLREAGVYWLENNGDINVEGDVFFTRMHVRYDREHFPQDLIFQETPNKQRFQGRYVMQKAVKGDLTCDEAQPYIKKVVKRREKELHQLANLTGWDISDRYDYVREFAVKVKKSEKDDNGWIGPDFKKGGFEDSEGWPVGKIILLIAALILSGGLRMYWNAPIFRN